MVTVPRGGSDLDEDRIPTPGEFPMWIEGGRPVPKSPEEMAASMARNLKEKTGKTMPQWLKIVKACGESKHGQIVKFLKGEHGVTHGFANLIAHEALQSAAASRPSGDLVDAQYGGAKADLKPIYDSLVAMVEKFGKDVEISPKKAYVSLRRNKQFGLIQPSTKTRVDVGINLKGTPPDGRLEATGSFNAMVSHRVKITEKKQVNAELRKWLKAAYDAS
jgi:hypothetical protein